MTIYVLSTVSGNRKLIKDIVMVLNETDIIHKGVEKLVENEYFSFESDEFECLDNEIYCDCGCQLFEDDEECPNCGRKTHI